MSRRRGDPHRQRPGSQELLVSTVASAPDSSAPIDAVAAALEAASAVFQERRESARHRRAVVAANAELRERELIKLASLASAIAGALRRRGVGTGRTSAARTPRRFARRLDQ
jgi:acyl-CoA reductase-like NAD-dependent aldehyde dehydrogenase